MKEYELRMYFFVPYNILDIQKGIQAGHASDEMALEVIEHMISGGEVEPLFYNWLKKWKTYIILNGGTTNENRNKLGSLQELYVSILEYNSIPREDDQYIVMSKFFEPDLNDTMTSFCFICDERVWDYENYPNYDDSYTSENYDHMNIDDIEEDEENWKRMMGGDKNIFLRELLKGKRFA